MQSALFNGNVAVKDPLTHAALDWNNPVDSLYAPNVGPNPSATLQPSPCLSAFGPIVPERLTWSGFVFRCPYNSNGTGGIVQTPYSVARTDPTSPVNFYSGSNNCPPNFYPRVAWRELDPTCSMGSTFCSCGFNGTNPSQGACTSPSGNIGCGLIQYMCIAMVDGTAVPSDGTVWSN